MIEGWGRSLRDPNLYPHYFIEWFDGKFTTYCNLPFVSLREDLGVFQGRPTFVDVRNESMVCGECFHELQRTEAALSTPGVSFDPET